MTDEENSLPDPETGGRSRRPVARVPVAQYDAPVYICDRRRNQSASLARRTWRMPRIDPGGQKELALPGKRKSKRGNGAAPAALPQDQPRVATRSVLSPCQR